jgi:hypothetical protein
MRNSEIGFHERMRAQDFGVLVLDCRHRAITQANSGNIRIPLGQPEIADLQIGVTKCRSA